MDGYDSFITFTNDFSHYGYIYSIKEISEALDKFKIFKAEVENQHNEVSTTVDIPRMVKFLDLSQSSYRKME